DLPLLVSHRREHGHPAGTRAHQLTGLRGRHRYRSAVSAAL
ncbi:MAG: hypothetical protein AVDCRST_MAG93-2943, partial [uncultured Chloroflexia bacterium]